jgi:hypothetical protein
MIPRGIRARCSWSLHGHVLGTHQAGFEHGETGGHEHDEEAADEEQQRVEDPYDTSGKCAGGAFGLLGEAHRGRGGQPAAPAGKAVSDFLDMSHVM